MREKTFHVIADNLAGTCPNCAQEMYPGHIYEESLVGAIEIRCEKCCEVCSSAKRTIATDVKGRV